MREARFRQRESFKGLAKSDADHTTIAKRRPDFDNWYWSEIGVADIGPIATAPASRAAGPLLQHHD